jgi:hypothetical protein
MKSLLIIKDLVQAEEMDQKSMAAVIGGIIGGTIDCGGFHAGMTVTEAVNTFVCKAEAIHEKYK